jgi:Fic-DOC domain mobile mystery protein B
MTIQLDTIEGATQLDPDEIKDLIPSHIFTRGQLNVAEQANIAEARVWALTRDHEDVLSEGFVRDLHKRMFSQVWRWAGKYRKTIKNLGVEPNQIAVQVTELCKNSNYWIKEKIYSWDEIGARFHHRLVVIHPFPDGNGRHARLMTDIMLVSQGQSVFSWGEKKYPAENPFTDELRKEYIAALKAADRDDFSKLLAFVRS